MPIFWREMKASWKTLLIWTVILGALNFLTMAFYPSIVKEEELMAQLLASFPEGFLKAFGMDKLNLSDPLGFYSSKLYSFVALIGGIFGATLGSSILAKEEEYKTIEFLLAKPISRSKIITSKLLSIFLCLALFNLLIGIATLLGFVLFVEKAYDIYILLALLAAPWFAHLFFASIALVGSLLFSRRKAANPLGIGVALALYALNILSSIAEPMSHLKYITPFYYIDPLDIISLGMIDPSRLAIIITFVAAALGLSYLLYNRRDITV